MRLHLAIVTLGLLLPACTTTPPETQTRVVYVPSSKPYRYLKPSPKDVLTKGTLSQIERHNQVHWKVKEAEKAAAKKKSD